MMDQLRAYGIHPDDAMPAAPVATWTGEPEPLAAQGKQTLKANQSALTRAQVVNLYNTLYVPGDSTPMGFTGTASPCNPGNTSTAYEQATLDRANFYRQLSGLPVISAFAVGSNEQIQTQQAGLMHGINDWTALINGGGTPHIPPAGWTCYTAGAATASGKSNLSKGNAGPDSVSVYIDDFGAGNADLGHRRWILYPRLDNIASGDAEFSPYSWPTRTPANALWVIGIFGTRTPMPDGVAWPPGGFVPYQALPFGSNRWSLSFPSADFTNATVTMSRGATPINITSQFFAQYQFYGSGSYLGDNTFVWLPQIGGTNGISYSSPGATDVPYTITVSGITGSGVPSSITWPWSLHQTA